MNAIALVFLAGVCAGAAFAQNDDYRLALPDHKGQLKWSVEGFQIVQNSAKPNGQEIGVR